jgi:hypothetical protein
MKDFHTSFLSKHQVSKKLTRVVCLEIKEQTGLGMQNSYFPWISLTEERSIHLKIVSLKFIQ